jgi:hypothetical protein
MDKEVAYMYKGVLSAKKNKIMPFAGKLMEVK